MSDDDNTYEAALRRERAGYVARGDDDRAAQVDAELRRIGAAVETPPAEKPAGRSTRQQKQSTADQPEAEQG